MYLVNKEDDPTGDSLLEEAYLVELQEEEPATPNSSPGISLHTLARNAVPQLTRVEGRLRG